MAMEEKSAGAMTRRGFLTALGLALSLIHI